LGFIHKDLKPCNILIDRDGHCVIADVGGSEIIPGISPTDSITKCSPGIITPEYAAPELYWGDEKRKITYTQAVDLWSLGATLCDLITASIPGHLVVSDDGSDDGYSVQALGLDPSNILKTLRDCKCPEGVTEVVMQVCSSIFYSSSILTLATALLFKSRETVGHRRPGQSHL
jgi:serine/threonine protein kinase